MFTIGYYFTSVWGVQVKRGLIARRNQLVVDQQLGFDNATHIAMRMNECYFNYVGFWATYENLHGTK